MQVKEIMTRQVQCVAADASIREAAQRMKDRDIGMLPIRSEDDQLVGMLSDRDIVLRGVARGEDPTTIQVCAAMTPTVVSCFEDQDVADAAALMKEHRVRRLVVLDRDKRLVGIVSLGDIAVDTRDEHLAGSALEAVCEPVRR